MKIKKNAGLTSIKEALKRMLDGEVFYFNGDKIYFGLGDNGELLNKNTSKLFESIFIVERMNTENRQFKGTTTPLNLYLTVFKKWEVEAECYWYQHDISEGILCWVSDKLDSEGKMIKHNIEIVIGIDEIHEGKFVDLDKIRWKYAEPLTLSELKEYSNRLKSFCV